MSTSSNFVFYPPFSASHSVIVPVFDSFGKLPSGLNRLNLMPLGRYTDCNSIIVPRTTNGGRSFEGNYCRATFRIPMPETSAQISRQCHGQHKLINALNM
uniref:Nose resistant-to-fluoxetine protein N-terminal domain-containing protein n=1 Tax=Romanomermis culicivorax TaxID=13658 RepID=A0A915L0Z1_ROMCU